MAAAPPITPEMLVWAYAQGIFPMARSRHGPIDWYSPDPRAVLPLHPPEAFHVSRSLRRHVRQGRFRITRDACFEAVMRACAEPRPQSDETWINDQIIQAYTQLHRQGLAHSLEAWLPAGEGELNVERGASSVARDAARTAPPDGGGGVGPPPDPGAWRLAGGIYGVSLGGVFFGESMFSRATDASKVCLVHLVEHLRARGYRLFDVQLHNPHLEQFGVQEISRARFLRQVRAALRLPVTW